MAKKILIIEDESYLLDMYKTKFRQAGYEVDGTTDGAEGIQMAEKMLPDLVLLDLVMPGMDGYEVLEKIKKNPKTKGAKAYILSNLGQNGEIKKGFQSGADGYLIKSDFTPGELAKAIDKIFQGEPVGADKKSD